MGNAHLFQRTEISGTAFDSHGDCTPQFYFSNSVIRDPTVSPPWLSPSQSAPALHHSTPRPQAPAVLAAAPADARPPPAKSSQAEPAASAGGAPGRPAAMASGRAELLPSPREQLYTPCSLRSSELPLTPRPPHSEGAKPAPPACGAGPGALQGPTDERRDGGPGSAPSSGSPHPVSAAALVSSLTCPPPLAVATILGSRFLLGVVEGCLAWRGGDGVEPALTQKQRHRFNTEPGARAWALNHHRAS